MTPAEQHPIPPPAARCAAILGSLREHMGRYAAWGFLLGLPLLFWLHKRLQRCTQRIQRLAERLAAGRLRLHTGPPRPGRRRGSPPPRPPLLQPPLHLPRGFNWLLRHLQGSEPARQLVRLRAAATRSHLEELLSQPDMQALLRAAPPIGRELRPICRMFGVTIDPALFPPPRRRQPDPPPEPPARTAGRTARRTPRQAGPAPPPAAHDGGCRPAAPAGLGAAGPGHLSAAHPAKTENRLTDAAPSVRRNRSI